MLNSLEIEVLLGKLCIELGFCLSPEAHSQIVSLAPPDVGQFVAAVVSAEGLDPDTMDRELYRQVRTFVAKAFAAATAMGD